jgi:hypothetical protein
VTSLFDDLENETPEYQAFVDKFKPKKTTDDCYTPPEIYECIKDYVVEYYGIEGRPLVRPFYPGGDYQTYNYPEGCVVLDNPPFSIVSKICKWYAANGIDFFLFAPSLTTFSGCDVDVCTRIIADCQIVYENGAKVKTSFVTNLAKDAELAARTAPELTRRVNAVSDDLRHRGKAELPKYTYPDNVVTAAIMQRYARYGVEFSVKKSDCMRVRELDSQKQMGKTIYGTGLLPSERAAAERAAAERAAAERAAAERAAAERAAAHVWELSERERELVAMLGRETC